MEDKINEPQPAGPAPENQPPAPAAEAATPEPAAAPEQPTAPYAQPPVTPPVPAPGQPYQGYDQPAYGAAKSAGTGALVCGILAIVFSWLPLVGIALGIVAIVLAVKTVKQSGKNGKTTGGKVCGAIGIALAVVCFVIYLLFGSIMMALVSSDDLSSEYDAMLSQSLQENADEIAGSLPDASSLVDPEETAAIDAATPYLQSLGALDDAQVQAIVDEVDQRAAESVGMTLSEMGVDPASLVRWVFADYDYEIDDIQIVKGGTSTIYALATVRDADELGTLFLERTNEFVNSSEMDAITSEEELIARVGQIYEQCLSEVTGTTTAPFEVSLTQEGDAYVVDEEAWQSQLLDFFAL